MTGLVLAVVVTAASVRDCDGARPLLLRLAASVRTVSLVWAGGGRRQAGHLDGQHTAPHPADRQAAR